MKDRILLTPGPLTTSPETKAAMLSDFGSWDGAFNALTASVCRDLLAIAEAQGDHVCVPLQGSGTFSVEAALGTLVPRDGKVLVPDNGAYCKRIVRILGYLGRERRGAAAWRTGARRSGANRCRVGRRRLHHARRASALRNRHRNLESASGDCGGRGRAGAGA